MTIYIIIMLERCESGVILPKSNVILDKIWKIFLPARKIM